MFTFMRIRILGCDFFQHNAHTHMQRLFFSSFVFPQKNVVAGNCLFLLLTDLTVVNYWACEWAFRSISAAHVSFRPKSKRPNKDVGDTPL